MKFESIKVWPLIGKEVWYIHHFPTFKNGKRTLTLKVEHATIIRENNAKIFLNKKIGLINYMIKREDKFRFTKEEAKQRYLEKLMEKERKLMAELDFIHNLEKEVYEC
jgi:uncharacterized protein YqgQ